MNALFRKNLNNVVKSKYTQIIRQTQRLNKIRDKLECTFKSTYC
jgi:hypothetical protein